MEAVFRYYVALYLARPVPQFSKECWTIVGKMTVSPHFTNLAALLADATSHLDTLDAAEIAAHHGPKGAVATRNAARLVVRGDMLQLKGGVQVAADSDLTHGKEIIEGAGMYAVIRGKKGKADLFVQYGGALGEVVLFAKAFQGQGVYEWQMSGDQLVWADLPQTVYATTTVTGLPVATVQYFRYRTFTKAGHSAWSSAVSIIVH
jgi:hypothetical protein